NRRVPVSERGNIFQMRVIKTLLTFDDRFGGVDSGASGVADVYAEADPLFIFFDGLPYVVRRGEESLVFRATIVNGQFDVGLLDHFVQDRHRVRARRANDRGNSYVTRVFKGLSNIGFARAHRDVADAHRNQSGVTEHLRALLALLGRMRDVNVVF